MEYTPNAINLNLKIVRMILVFGFIPYLSSIAGILYNQIDKFFIAGVLSLEELGKFYLATVFINVFVLVPNSINNLMVPNAINYYNERKLKSAYRVFTTYLSILVGYGVIVFLLLETLGYTVIGFVFPDKLYQLHYVFVLLPGMIATTIGGGFGFILYVCLHYKSLLWNNIFSLISYLILLGSLLILNNFTLENVAYAKTLQGIFVFLFLLTMYLISRKKINNYYYLEIAEKRINK